MVCPGCERENCSCPVCNGRGKSRGRGYETDCQHCRSILLGNLRAKLSAALDLIAKADEMRSWYRKQMGPDGPEDAYDEAREQFRKEHGDG